EIWSKILGIEKSVIGIETNFFELGGHSLKATILIAKIHKVFDVKVPLAEIFNQPFIKEIAKYIEQTAVEVFLRIEPVEKKDRYVLSSAQKRHYILQQLEPDGIGYNESLFFVLEGQLDRDRFEHTIRKLIQRHESLRTSFHMVKNVPVQRVHDNVEFEIEYYDIGDRRWAMGDRGKEGLKLGRAEERKSEKEVPFGQVNAFGEEPAARNSQPATTFIANFIRPFDFTRAPLLRVG
ncbi:MAG: hypothetical protein GY950_03060, partial [bacterium]|nr:hypothetical protein [bacterium]